MKLHFQTNSTSDLLQTLSYFIFKTSSDITVLYYRVKSVNINHTKLVNDKVQFHIFTMPNMEQVYCSDLRSIINLTEKR